MDEMITITRKEYFQLRCDSEKLSMLEAGGVDNWEWYGESLNPEGEPLFEEIIDGLKVEILGEEADD